MSTLKRMWLYLLFFILSPLAQAQAQAQAPFAETFGTMPNEVINTQVKDQHKFYGLASYYNAVKFIKIDESGIKLIKNNTSAELNNKQWLAIIGRHNVLTVQADGLKLTIKEDQIFLGNPDVLKQGRVNIIPKHKLKEHALELDQIRYSHLLLPINILARGLEAVLTALKNMVGSWGLAIVAISIFLRILMLPLSRLVSKYQKNISKIQAELTPKLAEIKAKYKGEEAHKHFVAAHKKAGVSTFYTLKPMIGLVIQIPIWIAIFNVLAEMPQIAGHSFLWINDLAYPDAIATWTTPLPLIGNSLNLLPLLMTLVATISTLSIKDKIASAESLKKQKRNLLFMAAAFLILFYPFPSGMVLYWTFANFLTAIQQLFTKDRVAL